MRFFAHAHENKKLIRRESAAGAGLDRQAVHPTRNSVSSVSTALFKVDDLPEGTVSTFRLAPLLALPRPHVRSRSGCGRGRAASVHCWSSGFEGSNRSRVGPPSLFPVLVELSHLLGVGPTVRIRHQLLSRPGPAGRELSARERRPPRPPAGDSCEETCRHDGQDAGGPPSGASERWRKGHDNEGGRHYGVRDTLPSEPAVPPTSRAGPAR
jgi:hypothetical protein